MTTAVHDPGQTEGKISLRLALLNEDPAGNAGAVMTAEGAKGSEVKGDRTQRIIQIGPQRLFNLQQNILQAWLVEGSIRYLHNFRC